jgi:hypothetical protein
MVVMPQGMMMYLDAAGAENRLHFLHFILKYRR